MEIKATSVFICIFTPQDKGSIGLYPVAEQYLYQMFGNAIVTLRQRHGQNNTPVYLDFCPVSSSTNNLQILEQNGGSILNLPAVQLYAKYPDGTAGQYFLKKGVTDIGSDTPLVDEKKALAYTEALLYRASPAPETLLCKLLPPLCSLGWYVWLGAALYTTYRTTQARNVGKYVWGGAAALTWNEFIGRGGLKELGEKVGINGKNSSIGRIYPNGILGDYECFDGKWTDSHGRGSCSYHGGRVQSKPAKQYQYFSRTKHKWIDIKDNTAGHLYELKKYKYPIREKKGT